MTFSYVYFYHRILLTRIDPSVCWARLGAAIMPSNDTRFGGAAAAFGLGFCGCYLASTGNCFFLAP